MAALTADKKIRQTSREGRRLTGDVAASTIIYYGALVAKNAAGYIVPASDTAALKVVGVALENVDNSSGANGAKTVLIAAGEVFEFVNAGGAILQASKHGLCYAVDDQSVTTAAVAVNDVVAGVVESFTTTTVMVLVAPEIGATA